MGHTLRVVRWAGLAAVVGSGLAIALTLPFATAYFLAYPGDTLPFWFDAVEPRLEPQLTFADPTSVYAIYGRLYNVVYVLLLPLVLAIHRSRRAVATPAQKRWFVVLVSGLVATALGVAGDYWGNGIGFLLEVLGLLTMMVGVTMWGLALLRGTSPVRWAWVFVACGPGALGTLFVLGHVPSGPTLAFALAWLVAGVIVMSGRDAEPA